ncbi:hypothetical protein ACFX5Q_30485 [Mesorhizobium sp. IMUNJ 23033]|uniref:hypothetical protein n=1 Tax=Mesorhizobium sp. IMUNJ 23033 TaxID=3378039 RepID=UPI00384AAFD2
MATAYWTARKINNLATDVSSNTLRQVRKSVNGGVIGLDHTRLWLARARQAFGPALSAAHLESAGVEGDAASEELEAARDILGELGFLTVPQGALEAAEELESAVDSAVKTIQRSEGLPDTGLEESKLEGVDVPALPEEVLYDITDPQLLAVDPEEIIDVPPQ